MEVSAKGLKDFLVSRTRKIPKGHLCIYGRNIQVNDWCRTPETEKGWCKIFDSAYLYTEQERESAQAWEWNQFRPPAWHPLQRGTHQGLSPSSIKCQDYITNPFVFVLILREASDSDLTWFVMATNWDSAGWPPLPEIVAYFSGEMSKWAFSLHCSVS